jgi:drug/metabolite transporter (DMT)-like permease
LANGTSAPLARSRFLASNDLLMLGAVLIWGINFGVLKFALQYFSPLAFNAVRFSLATLVMLVALRWQRESLSISRADLLPVAGLGLLGHTLYQLVFINGMARTSPANASLLMATSPIFVLIYGRILGIERTNRVVWGGIAVSFVGIILLVLGGEGNVRLGGSTVLGDVLVLGAAMLWAGYTAGSKPLLARLSPVKLTTASMVFGTIPLVLISVPSMAQQDWSAPTAGAWAGLFYSAVFSVAIGYVAWYTSVRRVGSARTAIFANLTPVVSVVVAWLFLGYKLTPLQLAGGVVVLAGLMLTRQGRRGGSRTAPTG